MRKIALFLLFLSFEQMYAQLYVETGNGTAPFDLCTCEQENVIDPSQTSSIAAGPDNNPYYLVINEIYMFDVASGTAILLDTLPSDGSSVSMVYGPNNTIYMAGVGYGGAQGEVLFSYNTVTGVLTNLGEMPPDFFLEGDLFFYNGQLYGWMVDIVTAETVAVEIPVNNPAGATVAQIFNGIGGLVGGISVIYNGVETVFALGAEGNGDYGLYQIDLATGEFELFCPNFTGGDLGAPLNFEVPACCENFAGNFDDLNLLTACQNQNITLTHLGDEVLTPGSALSFILMADSTGDLPDDILQISANPTFSFDAATMVLNQNYFVAAVAAPGSAGAPDWSAGCLDVSFFAAVKWLGLPSVSFSIPNPTVCAGGCLDFEVNFSGAPPFSLTFEHPFSGVQSQIFSAQNGILQICPPAGTPDGDFNLSAVSLSDANCVCN